MGEKAKKIGEKLEGFGERLYDRFGWNELTRDQEIKCTKSSHKKKQGTRTHGVDLYHKYYDPYRAKIMRGIQLYHLNFKNGLINCLGL